MTSSALAFAGFLAACLLAAASGAVFRPAAWFEALDQPPLRPPRWVFAPMWGTLYLLTAIAGWRVWAVTGLAPGVFAFYGAQLVFNAAWSACFFGLRRPDLAFADIVLLAVAIAGTIATFAGIDRTAAWLLIPYLAWVGAAGALNLSLWRRNRVALGLF